GVDTRCDCRLVGRLFLEIALDHRRELIEGLEHREVELGEEALGEDDPAVAVGGEWLYDWPPGARLAGAYTRPRGAANAAPVSETACRVHWIGASIASGSPGPPRCLFAPGDPLCMPGS